MHAVEIQGFLEMCSARLLSEQNKTEASRSGMGTLAFQPDELRGFVPGQEATVIVTGRTSSTTHDTVSASGRFLLKI